MSSLIAGSVDDEVSIATVLRAFEALRRMLTQRVSGCDGMGVGYDYFNAAWRELAQLEDGGTVLVRATMVGTHGDRHQVEYVATPITSDSMYDLGDLIRARGWTLAKPC